MTYTIEIKRQLYKKDFADLRELKAYCDSITEPATIDLAECYIKIL